MTGVAFALTGAFKRYGAETVLEGVDLTAAPGERLALVGHNGAGKTTLIKLLAGLSRPDNGCVEVLGRAPGSSACRQAVAYLPENVAFHGLLTGREQLTYYARLRSEPVRAVPGLLEQVGLGSAAEKRIAAYSKGMRQRLGLAQLLLGAPRLVLLDEPTSGLDPLSREMFYDLTSQLAASGACVLLSSHALTELEARTDRIAILSGGRLVADGRLSALRAQAGLPVRLKIEARPDAANMLAGRLGGTQVNGCAVEIVCEPGAKIARLGDIAALGADVRDVEIIPPSLEDLFRHYTRPGTMGGEQCSRG